MLTIKMPEFTPGEDILCAELMIGMCDIVLHNHKEHLTFMTDRGLVSLTDPSVFWDLDKTVRHLRPVKVNIEVKECGGNNGCTNP